MRPQTQSFVVPIVYTNLPKDLVVTKYNTKKVSVTLSGRGSNFIQLQIRKPIYQLNISTVKPGLNRIKLVPDELVVSTPVLLKSVSPEYAEITTEELERKIVTVIVPHRLEVQKGRYITDIKINDTIILAGPLNQMRFINEVMTESLRINDLSNAEIMQQLKIVVPDTLLFKAFPESATVVISTEKETTRTFSNIKVMLTASEKQVTIKPKVANITVRGPVSQVRILEDSDVILKIDVSKLTAGEYNVPAEIVLPKNIYLISCEPQLFNVRLE